MGKFLMDATSSRTLSIKFAQCSFLIVIAIFSGDVVADPYPLITLHYFERKPFQYTSDDGEVTGLVIQPAVRAFQSARINVSFERTPVNRIIATIRANTGLDCSAGWYKNPAREAYAQFSLPIYRDKPMVVLARSDADSTSGHSVQAYFARPQTILYLKQGFVFGTYLDALIAKMPPNQVKLVADEIPSIVRMIRAGFAEATILTQEEVEVYVKQSGFGIKDFHVLTFEDIPAVEYRYIMCSKQVPSDLMSRLNSAISAAHR